MTPKRLESCKEYLIKNGFKISKKMNNSIKKSRKSRKSKSRKSRKSKSRKSRKSRKMSRKVEIVFEDERDEIENNIRKIMINLIKSKLKDTNPSFTKNDVNEFVTRNNKQILNAASKMVSDYEGDDELDDLKNPNIKKSWVKEYLEEIEFPEED